MKRLSVIFMAALMVLAMSCKKNETDDLMQGLGFRVTMENQGGNSKTHLVPNENGGFVVWDDLDAIMVLNGDNNSAKEFTIKTPIPTSGDEYAEFQSVDATQSFYTPNYTAYYPSSIYTAPEQVTLPETQYYRENSFGQGFNPMVAYSTDETLEFKNLCGLLALQFTGNCTVSCIRLTAWGEQNLWGTGEVSMDGTDGDMLPTLGALEDGSSTVYMRFNEEVTLSDTPTTFYFVLPEGSLAEGFEVVITDSNGLSWTDHTYYGGNTHNVIHRNKIRIMPEERVETNSSTMVALSYNCSICTSTVEGTVTSLAEPLTCEYGIVYSETDETPTIEEGAQKLVANNNVTILGEQDFTVDITNLTEDVQYYVRAYAIFDGLEGVQYSDEWDVMTVIYSTPKPLPNDWINGKNPHPFSVGEDKVVYFSQGNLQYQAQGGSSGNASAAVASGENVGGTWRFAEHQFDMVGGWVSYPGGVGYSYGNVYVDGVQSDNGSLSSTYTGWIDMFGWGTSGYNHGANSYQPWSSSESNADYSAYGDATNNLEGGPSPHTGMADWGKANTISNGGSNSWRTLTKDEWGYLLDTRKNGSGDILCGKGRVGDIYGLIILPDNWSCPAGLTFVHDLMSWMSWMFSTDEYNVYSYSEWALMENAGAVFLPFSCGRDGTVLYENSTTGACVYWSSTCKNSDNAYCMVIGPYDFLLSNTDVNRSQGASVRLVSDVAP